MKRNLKIFLLIAVCAITGICMLCVREENKKQQIHSVKKEEKETLVFLTSKRETRHIFEKIIAVKYDVPNDKLEMFDDYHRSIDEFYENVLRKNG